MAPNWHESTGERLIRLMKKIVILASGLLLATISFNANSQTAADGGAAVAVPPRANPGPGLMQQRPLPPSAPYPIAPNANLNGQSVNVSGSVSNQVDLSTTPGAVSATNQFEAGAQAGNNTNQFNAGTNQLSGGTDQAPLTPTSQAGSTNQVFATNGLTTSNQTRPRLQDQALTSQDQALLLQIRQAVLPQVLVAGQPAPISFIIRNGLVRIVGYVASSEDKQRVLSLMQNIPGIVRVYDALAVNTQLQTAAAAKGGTNAQPLLAPTSDPSGLPASSQTPQ
jgi:hypothetical protein